MTMEDQQQQDNPSVQPNMHNAATPPVRVFLSYARGDDEPFVKRLYADLKKAGFTVWFDRESLMSRGLTFHQEIKDAIRTDSTCSKHLAALLRPNVIRCWNLAAAKDLSYSMLLILPRQVRSMLRRTDCCRP